jgi:hypothetical protein
MGGELSELIARNNAIFRDANEKIQAKADEYGAPLERIPFLCECAAEDCTKILRLTSEQYRGVRANARHFMTAVGHDAVEKPVARLVSREDGYVVIEKDLP